MNNNNLNRSAELTESQIEQIARNQCPDMPEGQDAMPQVMCAIYDALDMARAVQQSANHHCRCGTALAHTHHHCTTPVMWRMYEKPDVFGNASAAARDVLAERHRQTQQEGATPEHDDLYLEAELPRAAAAYALSASGFSNAITLDFWPFSTDWWKPTTPRRNLVKAAALILAEIERIDRDPGDESHHDHLNGGSL